MRKPGERCKEGDAHFEWNNTNVQDKHFFKVMLDDFSERMTIPDAFLRNFGGKIPRTIKLESRNGYTFDVKVTKKTGKVVLESGWMAFVSAHDLKMGDFLVFKYSGESQMKTLIFDPSGCEKVCSCVVKKNSANSQQLVNISRSSDDIAMKISQNGRKTWKRKDTSKQGNEMIESSSMKSSEDDLNSHFVPTCIFPSHTSLTQLQKKKVEEKVHVIHSKTPIYGYVINHSSIHGKPCTVEISRKYADVYLPFDDEMLVLQHCRKRWNVRCCLTKFQSKRLLRGWREFAGDNDLQLGDICLFELLKSKKKYKMNVHIIRRK